tara:strand:+ start:13417 stop:14967 length:1551 start_codon:yes stop_codon:yes gene_type:complete
MVRRYYGGISSAGGIAEGFGQGFSAARGLIADREQARFNQARLDADAEAARLTQEFRSDQLANEAERLRLQTEDNRRTEEFRAEERAANAAARQAEAEARTAKAEAEAGLRKVQLSAAQAQEAQAKAERDKLDAQAREEDGIRALGQLDALLKNAKSRRVSPNLETVNELWKRTLGTSVDLNVILGADYQSDIANLTNVISQKLSNRETIDTSDPLIRSGVDALVNSMGGKMIGQVVDDTFLNAPPEFQTGNFRVVSREARGIDITEGPDGLMFSSDVLVTLENINKPGAQVHYLAPLTDGRDPSSTQRVEVPITQLIDGMAGQSILIDTMMRDFDEPIRRAKIAEMGGEATFREQVSREITFITQELENTPSEARTLSGKTTEELLNSPLEIQRLAEDRVLGFGRKTGRYNDQADRQLMQIRGILSRDPFTKRFKTANAEGQPTVDLQFSEEELFKIAATLSDEDGSVTKATRDLIREFAEKKGAVDNSVFSGSVDSRIPTSEITRRQALSRALD